MGLFTTSHAFPVGRAVVLATSAARYICYQSVACMGARLTLSVDRQMRTAPSPIDNYYNTRVFG